MANVTLLVTTILKKDKRAVDDKLEDIHMILTEFKMKKGVRSLQAASDSHNTSGCEFCRFYEHKRCEVYRHIHDSKVPLEYLRGLHKGYSKKTLPPGLIIKKSGIPGAGLGVFAAVDIPSGTVFGPYKGQMHHGKIRGRSSNFSWQIIKNKKHSHIVDASDPADSNWMRYVNCSRIEDEQNVTAFQHQWDIYYLAHHIVPAGTEILVYYGSNFGNHLGVKQQKVISPNRIRSQMRRNMIRAKRKSIVSSNKPLDYRESSPVSSREP